MKEFKLPNIDEEKTTLKTIRMKLSTINKLDELAKNNDMSVNRLINECIDFALDNLKTDTLKKEEKK